MKALGLRMVNLFSDSREGTNDGRIIATYSYTDEAGKVLFEVVRREPKDFKQRRPDGDGGWTWSLSGVRRVLYNLPEIVKAKSILVVEGEKDVERPASWASRQPAILMGPARGAQNTRMTCGESEWPSSRMPMHQGWPTGARVARSLIGIAETIRLIEALPQAKDLSEWVENGGTRERLVGIIKEAPALTLGDVERWQGPSA